MRTHTPEYLAVVKAWEEAKAREAEAKKQLKVAQDHYGNCYDDTRAAWVAVQEAQ